MKLVVCLSSGRETVGVKLDAGILLLPKLSDLVDVQASTVTDFIRDPNLLARLTAAIVTYGRDLEGTVIPEDEVVWAPCLPNPGKIICIGLNYRRHAIETNAPIPTTPIIFSKFSDTVAAHLEDIPLPTQSNQVDYEAELGVVIGKRAVGVSRNEALDYVFGYCNVNDLSARDLQMRTSQWLLGKTCEKFAPMGPYLVTADEIPNPNNLEIRTFVNGEKRQDSNTADMIFHVDAIIEYLSQHIALEPGDVILTGTPEGVILGHSAEQRIWLKDGDKVTIQIEKLGSLTNTFFDRK